SLRLDPSDRARCGSRFAPNKTSTMNRMTSSSWAPSPNTRNPLPESSQHYGSSDPFQRILVAARPPALDEDAVPDCELHQPPDPAGRVAAPLLLADQRGDSVRTEQGPDHRARRQG